MLFRSPFRRREAERRDLLVVAGEASGDRAAAGVLARLPGVQAFGIGGLALANVGAELSCDLRGFTALGIGDVLARARPVTTAFTRILAAVRRYRPRAALLVNYTEFNLRLAARLKARDVKVLWYIAPQIWAWRPGRAKRVADVVDKMAVILPFEEALWQTHGVDARYVGHPLMETHRHDRAAARRMLDLTPFAPTVALLPGSRPHEVRRLLPAMLRAYERVRRERASLDARLLLAPSIVGDARNEALTWARDMRVPVHPMSADGGASEVLAAFDVAFCASGTASLEAAVAGALPVIVYRTGIGTEVAARLFLRSDHIGLPNILLNRRAFPELLQREVSAKRLASTLSDFLEHPEEPACAAAEIRSMLAAKTHPSDEVAAMLRELL
jgi:lipid-A-disaccharide synthase